VALRYRDILQKAWPVVLANASVPLLGLSDTAVIGNLGSLSDLGAIAFGAVIFSFVYWGFGFLRMGTTGFVAQALGARDEIEVRAAFLRAMLMAVLIGVVLIMLQSLIARVALSLLQGSAAVEATTLEYIAARIWGGAGSAGAVCHQRLPDWLGHEQDPVAGAADAEWSEHCVGYPVRRVLGNGRTGYCVGYSSG
jgi:MATE family multidrug resistance protein